MDKCMKVNGMTCQTIAVDCASTQLPVTLPPCLTLVDFCRHPPVSFIHFLDAKIETDQSGSPLHDVE
jgi:hypothetical protein